MDSKWLVLLAFVVAFPVFAADPVMDPRDEGALSKTKQDMTNKSARQEIIKADPNAKKADQAVQSVVGAENTDEVYSLAADIFDTLIRKAGGDGMQVTDIVVKALKDPQSFSSQLTPEQLRRLKALADKVDAGSQKPKKAP